MSTPVNKFSDLTHPEIDPFEYPEQLPEHLGKVHKLLGERAEELEEEARRLEAEAQSLYEYVGYMDRAEVDGDVLAAIQETADTFSGQGGARWAVADQVLSAAELMERAQHAAVAQYGGTKVLRFQQKYPAAG